MGREAERPSNIHYQARASIRHKAWEMLPFPGDFRSQSSEGFALNLWRLQLSATLPPGLRRCSLFHFSTARRVQGVQEQFTAKCEVSARHFVSKVLSDGAMVHTRRPELAYDMWQPQRFLMPLWRRGSPRKYGFAGSFF